MLLERLKRDWNMSDDILEEVSNAFEPSDISDADLALGEANEFLNQMDGFGYDSPKAFWDEWCDENNLAHEKLSNPFTV